MKTLGRISVLFFASIFIQWIGAWSNIFVMRENGGKMPVLIFTQAQGSFVVFDYRHCELTTDSRYKLLTDIFPVPFMLNTHSAGMETMSIGDLLLDAGNTLMLLTPFLPFFFLRKRK